jgi:hypothetical protein
VAEQIPSEDEVLSDTPRIPTREELLKAREQEDRGFLFHLHRSGFDAHVRWLSIADLSTLVGLPVAQQNIVLKVFNDYRREQERQAKTKASTPLTWDKVLENQSNSLEIADVLVCNGFINPKVVMTEDDLDGNENTIVVTDLHKAERLRYSQIALGQNEEEAAKLAPFPEAGSRRVPSVSLLPKHEQRPVPEDALTRTGI